MTYLAGKWQKVANHHQMAPVTSVPEPYNQDWSSRRSVIGNNWFLNDQLWQSDYAVCLLYEQWQQCLKILHFNCRVGCKKNCCLFLCRMIGPQNGGGVKLAVVSTLQKTLRVKLYWNCCWNVAHKWFFKSSMAIKALQCLPIFHMA